MTLEERTSLLWRMISRSNTNSNPHLAGRFISAGVQRQSC